ncbi:MAG TPA: 23S rRNA (guanosine(2251)-2'-O)-methyltransferase RlmB [Candidatus Limnocylindria bacterium]|nr:23S rRNA (guanosine(2251)-2'-O)-methyltransferase RlmB [Candidatus Limnocylindria bacterium]
MEDFEKRPEDAGAPDSGPSDTGPSDSGPADSGNQRPPQPGFPAAGADELARRRRRGRRGRGGGQRFGQPQRGPLPPRPFAPRGPMPPRPMAPRDDEDSSQARELAAYERRQQAQRQRTQGGWRGGNRGWVPGVGTGGGGGGNFYSGGARGMRRAPVGQAQYSETIRRATAGPRTSAAPSHDAGEPIAGPHAVLEAIRAGRVIKRLMISNERGTRTGPVNELLTEAQERRIFVRYVDKLEVQRLSPIENHQGVVAIVEGKAGVDLDELLLHLDAVSEPALVLVVDSLQDPQNFGVLLRSAEGAGVAGVVIPRHRAVGLTPAVAKTSAGASEHLMIADVANLRQAIDALKEKGVWVIGADESGDMLYDEVDYRGPSAIVIGGEGEGIRRLVLEGCDQVVRIPMEGHVASLNAAAAGTVILYEALRQRRRDAAPPDTRTARPAAPLQIPENAADDVELAEGDEDVVLEAEAPGGSAPAAEQETTDLGPADDEISEGESVEVSPPAEKAAPKKRAARPRAKKKTED